MGWEATLQGNPAEALAQAELVVAGQEAAAAAGQAEAAERFET